MRDHFQIVSQSNDLDAFGGVQQGHSKHGFMLVITLSMGLGAIATGVSHRLVTRPDIPKPVGQGGGTLYLNRFFSQPVYVDGLEYDPNTHDDPVRAFVDGIAQRVASVIGGSSSRFDIWLIGFKSGRGWPLLSKAPFAEVYIDEYLPNDNKLRHQYTFEAGGDGYSPVRLSGIAGNFVVWSLGCAGLVTLADRLVRSMLRRWSRPTHGFPIVPLPPNGSDESR